MSLQMSWQRSLAENVGALILAALFGFLFTAFVINGFNIVVGSSPVVALFRAAVVTLIVAAVAPRAGFLVRFCVYSGMYVLEAALAAGSVQFAIWLVETHFAGDLESARPWLRLGILTMLTTGIVGYLLLRRASAARALPKSKPL